jgi:hypothetical protein
MVSGATKSYMRKFFPIYMRRPLVMTLHLIPLNFLIYKENFILFFISELLLHSYMLYSLFKWFITVSLKFQKPNFLPDAEIISKNLKLWSCSFFCKAAL